MGFFDFLTGGEEGQIKRHARRMNNLNTQSEERDMSAHWLVENGSDAAITGLLGRFTIAIPSAMKDGKEKEQIVDLLIGLGPRVTGPVKEWMRTHAQFAQPLRVIEHFEGDGGGVGILLEIVELEKDPFKTEKKRQALIKLAEHKDPRIAPAILPQLNDFDEGIRYASAEVLLAQTSGGDGDAPIIEALAARLASPEEDSNRLRVRVAEAFSQRRWGLGAFAEAVAARPPSGWAVQGDRMVQG